MYGNSQVVQKNKFFESLVWAGGDVHQKDKDYPAVVIVYGNPNGAVLLDWSGRREGDIFSLFWKSDVFQVFLLENHLNINLKVLDNNLCMQHACFSEASRTLKC